MTPQRAGVVSYVMGPTSSRALPVLEGKVRTSYSNGELARAQMFQHEITAAADFLEKRLGVKAKLELMVLSPADWERLVPMVPYGITNVSEQGGKFVAVVPASQDNVVTQEALAAAAALPAEWRTRLEEAGLSYAEVAKTFADLAAVHELGHVWANLIDVPNAPPWFGEFLATYLAYAYYQALEPKRALAWDALLATSVARGRPQRCELDDFERSLEEGLPAFLWHQGRYQQRVRVVHQVQGLDFIGNVDRVLSAGDKLPTAQLLQKLELIAPGFLAWAKAS
ncbi:MAG: hypothetical protein ACAI38_22920 [Myxococcota bacterium]|nr:hypothetical protein [Myxococcota bacterium]